MIGSIVTFLHRRIAATTATARESFELIFPALLTMAVEVRTFTSLIVIWSFLEG